MEEAMLKTRLFIFLLAFGALLAFVPSLSLSGIGKKAGTAEAAPATGIVIVGQDCISSSQIRLTLQWNPSGDGQQWIDVSLQNNNFAPNTFVRLGPLAPNQNTAVWEGVLAGRTHYLRINTNVGGNWQPTGTAFFTTRSCAGFEGVTELRILSQECLLDGTVRVNISWEVNNAGTQFVDLSLQNNGFAPNTFVGLGPFAANVETLTWDGILPGLTHYLRVNTFVDNIWIPSDTLVFTTRTGCANAPATNLHLVSQVCQEDGRVTATFAWNPSAQADEQWFDISGVNDNFSSPFFGFGPLDDDLATLSIPHLDSEKRYFVRLNTWDGSSWASTPTLDFDARECDETEFTTGDKMVDGTAEGPDQALLDDVRIGAHPADGFDRIVFEFDGPLPDATIGYVGEAVACGSGEPVPVAGSGTLNIRMSSTVAHDDMGPTAPLEIDGTGAAILEAVSTCDFEGVVVYAVGINGVRGFKVTVLASPNRIVVDVLR
jgi:hypothetical protein